MVELALCTPIVCLLLLSVVQVGLVVRDSLVVQHAAREAARAASVSTDPSRAARLAVPGLLDEAEVTASLRGSQVVVRVRGTAHTDVPLVGALLPDVPVFAEVTMTVEPVVPASDR